MNIRLRLIIALVCVIAYGCSGTNSSDDEQATATNDAGDVANTDAVDIVMDTDDDVERDGDDGVSIDADADANNSREDVGFRIEREGFYELTEVTYNREGCDLSQAQTGTPFWPYAVVRYEMTVFGPGFMVYRCQEADGCSPDNYDIWWNLKDVEADGAEELPAPENRALGDLDLTQYSSGWGDGKCSASRLRHRGEFGEGTIRITETVLRADVPEVDSQWDCTPDLARGLSDDRFNCESTQIWVGEKQ